MYARRILFKVIIPRCYLNNSLSSVENEGASPTMAFMPGRDVSRYYFWRIGLALIISIQAVEKVLLIQETQPDSFLSLLCIKIVTESFGGLPTFS